MMLSDFFKILSDETRLRMLHLLTKQDLCVCELVELLDLSQPKISKHMAKIRSFGLVESTQNEQFIYYSINKEHEYYNLLGSIFTKGMYEDDVVKLQQVTSFICER